MLVPVLGLALAPVHAGVPATDPAQPHEANAAPPAEDSDVIATVGDQTIHFRRLTRELDQGAVPGVSVPAYGTPERKEVVERLLDEAIRNELLYLDARRKGVDQDPAYQAELDRFKDNTLAGLFRERHPGEAEARRPLHEFIPSVIHDHALDPARDAEREDDEVLALVGGETITWGDAGPRLVVATRRAALSEGTTDAATERAKVLNQLIELRVMAVRARQSGLEQDPAYLQRLNGFEQTGLASFHYRQLAEELAPTEAEVAAYAQAHGKTSGLSDERVHRTIERALIDRKISEYLDGLQENGFPVTVDEARLERLLAQEAEQHAAAAEGGQTQ